MRLGRVGLAIVLCGALTGMAYAADETEEIQNTEEPGSEFEMDIENGKVEVGRERDMAPIEGDRLIEGDDEIDPLVEPSTPDEGDPIDDELPGEGPENLSGPLEDDPLPE